MRRLLLLTAALLGLLQPSVAQNPDEIAVLRKNLGVSDAVTIAPAATPRLPAERPLTIYIRSGDAGATAEVQKLVQEINKKQAEKYGAIEVVSDSAKANLWLIHFEMAGTRRKETDTSNSMDPQLGRGQTANVMKAEVRGYVLARIPNGLEILGRYKKDVTLGDRRMELRDAFNKVLKEQPKAEKH